MRVTIKDIAKYCGVSSGTVDRALNNRPGIKEKTKQKVLQARSNEVSHDDFLDPKFSDGRILSE